MMLAGHHRVHILAAGGVGMSAIAQVLQARGYAVTGSDSVDSRYTRRLAQAGVQLFKETDLAPVDAADLVVRSTAIRDTHPSWRRAKERGIDACHRSEVLADILNASRGVAIAGTHGKTTITAMAGSVFEAGGLDPAVLVGGWVDPWDSNVRLGASDWVIAEADESDGSFVRFKPELAVVSNVEPDHLDYFGSFENIKKHFARFAAGLKPGGTLWVGEDTRALLRPDVPTGCHLRSYGWDESPDLTLRNFRRENDRWCTDISDAFGNASTIRLAVAGRFNAENAAAAIGCGLSAGVSLETAVRALDTFRGTGRRQEIIADIGGMIIIDDYAHHATEIRVTLAAIRETYTSRRLVVVFQPHRYTRTRDHADELAAAFGGADVLCIAELYAASEDPIPGVSADALAERARQHHGDVRSIGNLKESEVALTGILAPGDVLVTMGAGDVTTLGPRMAEILRDRAGEER